MGAGVCIPEADCAVIATASEGFTVRTERKGANFILVADQRFNTFPAVSIPKTDIMVIAAASDDILMRVVFDFPDPAMMTFILLNTFSSF